MSESSSHGYLPPFRIPLPAGIQNLPAETQSQRKEAFMLIGGPGVTTEAILRSRITELEAQVENLKARLWEAKK